VAKAAKPRTLSLDFRLNDGRGNGNPDVVDWLSRIKLDEKTSISAVDLIELITDMLSILPQMRPDIKTVVCRLRSIALKQSSESIKKAKTKSPLSRGFKFTVQEQVFLEWLNSIDNLARDGEQFYVQREISLRSGPCWAKFRMR
jgi:hypothetical protein